MLRSLVGSEMCIRDSSKPNHKHLTPPARPKNEERVTSRTPVFLMPIQSKLLNSDIHFPLDYSNSSSPKRIDKSFLPQSNKILPSLRNLEIRSILKTPHKIPTLQPEDSQSEFLTKFKRQLTRIHAINYAKLEPSFPISSNPANKSAKCFSNKLLKEVLYK